jgi:hypothetical protein
MLQQYRAKSERSTERSGHSGCDVSLTPGKTPSKETELPAQDAAPVRIATAVAVFAVCAATALVGLVATAGPAAAEPALAAGTPCPTTAKACVDLTTQRAWLINNGVVTVAR